MHDHDGFRRNIAESPTDEAARLIYADWLDERDDPLGTMLRFEAAIAAQCGRAFLMGVLEVEQHFGVKFTPEMLSDLQALPIDVVSAMRDDCRLVPGYPLSIIEQRKCVPALFSAFLPTMGQDHWFEYDDFACDQEVEARWYVLYTQPRHIRLHGFRVLRACEITYIGAMYRLTHAKNLFQSVFADDNTDNGEQVIVHCTEQGRIAVDFELGGPGPPRPYLMEVPLSE
jgi:uncharacterized protein (TIGR02996 family)